MKREIWKLRASLAWAEAKGMSSFLTNQMIKGPTKPGIPMKELREERWAKRAQVRSSFTEDEEAVGGESSENSCDAASAEGGVEDSACSSVG